MKRPVAVGTCSAALPRAEPPWQLFKAGDSGAYGPLELPHTLTIHIFDCFSWQRS